MAADGVRRADLWCYIDDGGSVQGPYASSAMRGWLIAGYLRLSTRVAPSSYGEMPEQTEFAEISALWSHPQEQVSARASLARARAV